MGYTLALGPFTPMWLGPQRLILTIDGEIVSEVDHRAGYNERGCAERLTRLNIDQALHLVTRICGTTSHAHALAFCQALESLMDLEVPARAAYLRSAIAETERLSAHLNTLAVLFATLGLTRFAGGLHKLREGVQQVLFLLSGRRSVPDVCVPGGLKRNVDDQQRSDLLTLLARIQRRLFHIIDQIIDRRALLARTVNVGVLSQGAAEQFGLRGPLARASGLASDMRVDAPYAAYTSLTVQPIVQEGGDVYARLVVLLLEGFESVKLVEQIVEQLPDGDWEGSLPAAFPAGYAEAVVEAPQGLLRYALESDGRRLTAVTIDTPRQLDRLLARTLLIGALLDDVPLIVLSTASSVACTEC